MQIYLQTCQFLHILKQKRHLDETVQNVLNVELPPICPQHAPDMPSREIRHFRS